MGNEEVYEYDTFTLHINDREVEFAITEEFEFEGRTYIICGEVLGDTIKEDEFYLFEGTTEGDEIIVKSIETEEEYNRIAEAYYESVENEE